MASAGKKDRKIIALLIITVIIGIISGNKASGSHSNPPSGRILMDYETEIFDTTKPISVNIIMEENKWNSLLEKARKKKWMRCNVIVNDRLTIRSQV